MPIQGTASELIKVAMNNIYKTMIEKKLKGKMILQIHDELLFEIPISEKDVFLKLIKNQMENAIQFNVPIKVDANYDYYRNNSFNCYEKYYNLNNYMNEVTELIQ